MIKFDHVAITVNNLKESINFYKEIGYECINVFEDEDYRWANLRLQDIGLELFEMKNGEDKIQHIAYSFDEMVELKQKFKELDKKMPNLFYGDLNRESIFINDLSGNEIQFIKNE